MSSTEELNGHPTLTGYRFLCIAAGVGYLLAKSLLMYSHKPESLINIADIVYGVFSIGFLFWLGLYEHRPRLLPRFLHRFLFRDSIWIYLKLSSSTSGSTLIDHVNVRATLRENNNLQRPSTSNTRDAEQRLSLDYGLALLGSTSPLGTSETFLRGTERIESLRPLTSLEPISCLQKDIPKDSANSNESAQLTHTTRSGTIPRSTDPSIISSSISLQSNGSTNLIPPPSTHTHPDSNESTPSDFLPVKVADPSAYRSRLYYPHSILDVEHQNFSTPPFGLAGGSSVQDLPLQPNNCILQPQEQEVSTPSQSTGVSSTVSPSLDSSLSGMGKETRCANCDITKTARWRIDLATHNPLCSMCDLYLVIRGKHRPIHSIVKPEKPRDAPRPYSGPWCSHCRVIETPAWMIHPKTQELLCNDCGTNLPDADRLRPSFRLRGRRRRRQVANAPATSLDANNSRTNTTSSNFFSEPSSNPPPLNCNQEIVNVPPPHGAAPAPYLDIRNLGTHTVPVNSRGKLASHNTPLDGDQESADVPPSHNLDQTWQKNIGPTGLLHSEFNENSDLLSRTDSSKDLEKSNELSSTMAPTFSSTSLLSVNASKSSSSSERTEMSLSQSLCSSLSPDSQMCAADRWPSQSGNDRIADNYSNSRSSTDPYIMTPHSHNRYGLAEDLSVHGFANGPVTSPQYQTRKRSRQSAKLGNTLAYRLAFDADKEEEELPKTLRRRGAQQRQVKKSEENE